MTRLPIVGAHLSVGKGLPVAVQQIQSMGGSALQIFSGSPRSWARKPLDLELLASHRTLLESEKITLATHALYLINLTPLKDDLLQKSLRALEHDLAFTAGMGGVGVVVHLGSHLGKGFLAVREELAERLELLLRTAPEGACLLIENSAGQEGKIGSDLAEIQWLLSQLSAFVAQGKLGWCLDTCHAHAAGHDLADLDSILEKHDLQKTLKLVHVNDSKDPFNSGRDRHQNLGDGMIGEELMREALQSASLTGIPMILEVPGIDGFGPDAENLQRLKAYVGL